MLPPHIVDGCDARHGRRNFIIGIRLPSDFTIVDDDVLVLDLRVCWKSDGR